MGERQEEDTQRGALDALNAGLAEMEGQTSDEPVADEPGDQGDDQQEAESPPEAEVGDGDADGADEGDGEQAASEDEGDSPEGEEGEGESASERARDPVSDPIPSNLKAETRERIETLVGRVKELNQYREERDTLLGMIKGTGASPEEFGDTLKFLSLIHGEQADPKAAIDWLRGKMAELAAGVDEPIEGVSVLDSFPDLKEAVELGDVDEKFAIELAKSRISQRRQERTAPTPPPTLSEDIPYEQAQPLAVQALDHLGAQLAEKDPHYEHKMKILMPQLQQMTQNTHPAKWREKTLELYALVPAPAPKAPRRPNNPMRGRQTATPSGKEPGSALEALEMGLKAARR